MRGRAFVLGDDVNTGYITPAQYVSRPMDEITDHLFEPIRSDLAASIDRGDFVVAGSNFGTGSSRETAPAALHHAGVGAVIAESFARIFYRNCIAVGLHPIRCPAVTDTVADGDVLDVQPERRRIENRTSGETIDCQPLPSTLRAICAAGGLLAYYEEHPDGIVLEDGTGSDSTK